jgi:hypothetical protein
MNYSVTIKVQVEETTTMLLTIANVFFGSGTQGLKTIFPTAMFLVSHPEYRKAEAPVTANQFKLSNLTKTVVYTTVRLCPHARSLS